MKGQPRPESGGYTCPRNPVQKMELQKLFLGHLSAECTGPHPVYSGGRDRSMEHQLPQAHEARPHWTPTQQPSELREGKPCTSSFSGSFSEAAMEWVPQTQSLEHRDYELENTFSLEHEKICCFLRFPPTGIMHGTCRITGKPFSCRVIWQTVYLLGRKS